MKHIFTLFFILLLSSLLLPGINSAQDHSVARQWNEVLLDAIRADLSRPTVHSRNLYHVSIAMYDAWSAYDEVAGNCFLGRQVGNYFCEFEGVTPPSSPSELKAAREEAMSYAAYRLLTHRFSESKGADEILPALDSLMIALGYDTTYTSTDYTNGEPAALGNYLAVSVMEYGMQDHADEFMDYNHSDSFYSPVNPPINPWLPGNPNIVSLDHWQPIEFGGVPRRFLSPQWGKVTPYSLSPDDAVFYQKNGSTYPVYFDPGAPPPINMSGTELGLEDYYKWNFTLVALWSSHLDPYMTELIDISPATTGNIPVLPDGETEMRNFYNLLEGGVDDQGYDVNPITGVPYEPNPVPKGDFARVIAEFWADGPNSETPPGHWFTLLNYVSDHPLLEKKFMGTGEELDDLEWDVKAYLVLGGAMHDVAVAVWGIKSFYDYIRPFSSIRAMAELGQSSDPAEDSYHPGGLPLVEGHIEIIREGDPLAGASNENVGEIKLYAYQGPEHISDPENDIAGVDWILAKNWWSYQQFDFITPPFAGYISGHSTFSRAAAEVLTRFTGSEYFPGGMGTFLAKQEEYLSFEDGPSVDVELQWATYRDASDQASLSRIWGGIHPPVDDIPGRKIGRTIGNHAFDHSLQFFTGEVSADDISDKNSFPGVVNTPNPVNDVTVFKYSLRSSADKVILNIYDANGNKIYNIDEGSKAPGVYETPLHVKQKSISPGFYLYNIEADGQVTGVNKMIIY